MLRFNYYLFPEASEYLSPFIFTIACLGIIFSSLSTLRQIDTKRIIAYSSIAHMNYAILGLFSGVYEGLMGSVYLMLAHGIVSSGLFLCIGFLYDRFKTRNILYFRSISMIMPVFTVVFLIFNLANLGFPGTSNFIPELLIYIALIESNIFVAFISTFSLLFAAIHSFWFFTRIMYGYYIHTPVVITKYADLSRREFFITALLIFIIFWMGLYPNSFFQVFNINLLVLVSKI
jgi:NADH:ubiquinone oxidoreductase subunit 4 (subunit M)